MVSITDVPALVTTTLSGLKLAKELLSSTGGVKVDAAAKTKIDAAVKEMDDAQEHIYLLREELFKLQDEKRALTRTLQDIDEWHAKANHLALSTTAGGAVVYKHVGQPEYFACPSCFNKKEVQILQNASFGVFRCPSCPATYQVNPRRKLQARQADTDWKVL